MFSITLYLPTHVHYTIYTKSHISYCSNAYRCYTKCTAHQFFASSAVTLPGSTGVVRSEPCGKTGMSVQICPQQMWTSEVTRYFRLHTNIATDTHGNTNCGCRNCRETQNPEDQTPAIKFSLNTATIHESDDEIHTRCPRRNVRDFGRVFLMLNYTDVTQNTYVQS
jgi:hypothetical protein